MTTMRIDYADDAERDRKLVSIMESLGYAVAPTKPERITVGQLAKRVGRSVATVSRSLRRPSCPSFVGKQGMKRLLWLIPNKELLSYLKP